MSAGVEAIADPRFILLAWSAGLALVAGLVAVSRLVGTGFTWLIAGSSGVIGIAGTLIDGAWWSRAGSLALVAGIVWARNGRVASPFLAAAGVLYLIEAGLFGGWLPALTASVALGGVTGEMMLGHWYLVDPRLPRWTLRSLALVGIAGLILEGSVLSSTLPGGGATFAFWALLGLSILLMIGVLGALRYPAYSGVMAATGLSYLAVLTTLGAVFLGRALAAGIGPFAS